MKKGLVLLVMSIILVACSDVEMQSTERLAETIEDGTVGYEIVDGEVEAAQDVPADVEQEVIAALTEYIEAFNEKDFKRFEQTVSQQDETYYTETMKEAESVFAQYSVIEREAQDVTISKYEEDRVEVFLNMNGRIVEAGTELEMAASARQIIILVKEDRTWKVSSVHSINI